MITLYYESRFGLARAAVYKDGLPHLYAEGLESDPSVAVLGTRSVARLKARVGGMLFLALAGGEDAVLEGPQSALDKLAEGAAVQVEIIAEQRSSEKLARARFVDMSDGEPRRISSVIGLKDRLLVRARCIFGEGPVAIASNRDAVVDARDQAFDASGSLPNGGFLSIEPTRALIACDVDSAQSENSLASTPKSQAKACNELAVRDLPRRLRLSGHAGLVVVDLIGKRHDFERLKGLLLEGFGRETGIVVAPIGKFGTLEFVRPWSARPLKSDFQKTGDALYWLFKAIELSEQDHGRMIVMRLHDRDVKILKPLIADALDPLAPMLRLEATTTRPEVLAL